MNSSIQYSYLLLLSSPEVNYKTKKYLVHSAPPPIIKVITKFVSAVVTGKLPISAELTSKLRRRQKAISGFLQERSLR